MAGMGGPSVGYNWRYAEAPVNHPNRERHSQRLTLMQVRSKSGCLVTISGEM